MMQKIIIMLVLFQVNSTVTFNSNVVMNVQFVNAFTRKKLLHMKVKRREKDW